MIQTKFKFVPDRTFRSNVQKSTAPAVIQVGKILTTTIKRSLRRPLKGDFNRAQRKEDQLARQQKRKPREIKRPPSRPGKPPNSHKPQQVLKRSIGFASREKGRVVRVGQNLNREKGIDIVGIRNEFGRDGYDKRPFMSVGLDKVLASNKIPEEFKNILRG